VARHCEPFIARRSNRHSSSLCENKNDLPASQEHIRRLTWSIERLTRNVFHQYYYRSFSFKHLDVRLQRASFICTPTPTSAHDVPRPSSAWLRDTPSTCASARYNYRQIQPDLKDKSSYDSVEPSHSRRTINTEPEQISSTLDPTTLMGWAQ
jgi:hypothetical protein